MAKAVLGDRRSGVYDLPGLEDSARSASPPLWRAVGRPALRPHRGDRGGVPRPPRPRPPLSPSGIDYRANIDALKRAGVTDLVSVSACGSSGRSSNRPVRARRPVRRPHLSRASSFFGNGCVAHVSMAHPVGPALQARIAAAPRPRDRVSARAAPTSAWRPALLQLCRVDGLQGAELRRDRHDQHAGGQARPRGRDHLRHHRDGDRLRLLATRTTTRRRGGGGGGGPRQRRQGRPPRPPASPATSRRARPCPARSDRALDGAVMTRRSTATRR